MSVLMAFLHTCNYDYKRSERRGAPGISRRISSFPDSEGETFSINIFLMMLLASSAFPVPRQSGIPCTAPPTLPRSPCQPWGNASREAAGDPWTRALPDLPGCSRQVALQERLSGRPGPGTAPKRPRNGPEATPAPALPAAGAPPAARPPPLLLLLTMRAAGMRHPSPVCCSGAVIP